jgi:hypothetical protein
MIWIFAAVVLLLLVLHPGFRKFVIYGSAILIAVIIVIGTQGCATVQPEAGHVRLYKNPGPALHASHGRSFGVHVRVQF